MTESEGKYIYRDNEHAKGRFLNRFQRVLDLHYTPRFPAPDAVVDEAWQMLARNRTEREVVLAIDWLREGFDKAKPVRTLRAAREHAHDIIAKEQSATRNEARGGMDSLLSDTPTASRQSRAYLACTRWCAREIAELCRQGNDIGHPERQAVHEYHAKQFAAIDRNDPETVGRWIDWAEAERQVHEARKGVRRAG